MTKQPHQRYSIDGFVPNGQGRQIGFGNQPQPRGLAGRQPKPPIRLRRPAGHAAPSGRQPVMQDGFGVTKQPVQPVQPARDSLSGFSSYGTAGTLPRPQAQPTRQRRTPEQLAKANAAKAKKRSRFRDTNWKKVFKRTALASVVLLLLGGGWMGWQFFKTSNKVFGDSSILGFLNSTKLRGEENGRVNILLAGVSTDDPDHAGAALADSIMVISLDTKHNKAMMLSVPRDLWVDIPGYGHSKINATNAYGDQDNFSQAGLPPGGMGLLAKTINENFELPIHYYAKVNYGAFRDAVNAVGGIEVTIKSEDRRGLYDPNIAKVDGGPLKLPNGPQKLDGQTALNLARARGNPTGDGRFPYGFERSDFTRTEHQRQMLLALKERISSPSVISNPLKVGQLFEVVAKNLKTDFEPSEVRRLYDLNKQIKASDIVSVSLNDVNGSNLLASYRSPDGASALIPAAGLDDFSDIQLTLKKLMSSDPVVKESAKIVVLNGGDVTGLASKESNSLTSKGLNVVAVGDAPRQEGGNVIIDLTGKTADNPAKPGTKARLQQIFKATISTDNSKVGYPSADFIIILGTNHRPPASTATE